MSKIENPRGQGEEAGSHQHIQYQAERADCQPPAENFPNPTAEECHIAADLIGQHCIGWANVHDRRENVAVHLPPDPSDPATKRWVSNVQYLNSIALRHSIMNRTKGFAVRHRTFTDTLILDIDNPPLAPAVFATLHRLGLRSTLIIASGRGIHVWLKFDHIPAVLMKRAHYGSAQAVMHALGELIRSEVSPSGIDIRGDGSGFIALPGTWNPFYECYLLPPGCRSWSEFIQELETIPDRLNVGELILEILKHARRPDPPALEPIPSRSDPESFMLWYKAQSVQPHETNAFTLAIVTQGFRAGIAPDALSASASAFYNSPAYHGRATERDFMRRVEARIAWRQKVGHGGFNPLACRSILESDLAYLQEIAGKRGATEKQLRFLALHYLYSQATDKAYYLSQAEAAKHGISRGTFRTGLLMFGDILHVVEKGEPRQLGIRHTRATSYRLCLPVPVSVQTVEIEGLDDLAHRLSWSLDAAIYFQDMAASGSETPLEGAWLSGDVENVYEFGGHPITVKRAAWEPNGVVLEGAKNVAAESPPTLRTGIKDTLDVHAPEVQL